MKAKICGVTTLLDAKLAKEANADFIGLIFHKKSKRYVEEDTAKEILAKIKEPPIVGVFLDESIQEIASLANKLDLKWVQLLAPNSPEVLSPLDHLHKILVFRVGEEGEYHSVSYKNPKGYWLYDGLEVGSGKTFNWDRFAPKEMGPFFIAGGLKADNVDEVIKRFHPDGLDVATAVAKSDQVTKDREKVVEFVKKVHHVK